MLYEIEEVKKYLPHREPFLFIDSVKSLERIQEASEKQRGFGVKSICHYRTRADHPIFAGHFPGNPILPGVVQVEMMAQAASFLVTLDNVESVEDLDIVVALMGVDEAKFRKPVLPEMDLVIVAECIKERGPVMVTQCELYHNDQLMSQAKILASIRY